ncbi:hypothetical protein JOY44_09010 [Phormidium sp. CLA17]|uniref:hypothetical protein n=1 Tax=Leptolyngbya sp. Cla-17 TaxID=2803751 RepID=UPI001490F772|nr:hypothetical protein [Leptolyngbya sp. Cla-17]MBM0741757.1 hypothetical protein [Leptolyngbya sp. Cla-17]
MLCLAQVEIKDSANRAELRILARQRSEYAWAIANEQDTLDCAQTTQYYQGSLVLVTLSDAHEILEISDVKDWLLNIISTLLVTGVTPQFLQKESERAEQWRQNLTLQSQDLDRRVLELEARREQLEQLEETLKREKKQIESLAAQYREQNEELDRRSSEIETR